MAAAGDGARKTEGPDHGALAGLGKTSFCGFYAGARGTRGLVHRWNGADPSGFLDLSWAAASETAGTKSGETSRELWNHLGTS